MFVGFKKYEKIGLAKMINIKVIQNDQDVIYEGPVEDAPEEVKNMYYYKITLASKVTTYYVYTDDYLATLDIDKLNELDTSGVEPMSHVFPVNNVFREDVVTNGDGSEDLMANAPEGKDSVLLVPMTTIM